jgi:FMN phosphatase YigB (HAD superfamily)
MTRVHSFDVFDTCLTRKCAVPTGVFYDVAAHVFARLGLPATESLTENFVAARVAAEHTARRQTLHEDVTLAEIWRILAASMGWIYDASLADGELETEEKLIVPIYSIRRSVDEARREGGRIVFLSDMYLPRDFIVRLLIKFGFAKPEDGFYVSSDVGKTKITGNLFRYLLAQEKVAAADVRHTGDHLRSDFVIPKSIGICATLFEQSRLTPTEIHLLEAGSQFPEIARIVGAMRVFRLSRETEDADMNEVISKYIAPFIMGFTTWALKTARENGVKRLYFLSRDCQLVCKVARLLAPQFGDLDCRYLYSSRQAFYLPAVKVISPGEMPWMRSEFDEPILKLLLAKLDLRYEDVESSLGALAGSQGESYRLSSEADWKQFWDALNTDPLKTRLESLIAARRKATHRYLEAEGLLDSTPWALVDFGWRLSCQKSLVELLRDFGRKERVQGYYLGLGRHRASPAEADDAEGLFCQKPEDYPAPLTNSGVFGYIPLIEYIVGCADHPSVHHYEENAGGAVGPAFVHSMDEVTLKFCQKLHEGVLDFVDKNQALAVKFENPTACRNLLFWLTVQFFGSPTPGQVRAVSGLPMAMDQNGATFLPIARPLNFGTALLPLLPRRIKLFAPLWRHCDTFWPEATLVVTPRGPRILSALTERFMRFAAKVFRSISGS